MDFCLFVKHKFMIKKKECCEEGTPADIPIILNINIK